MEPHKKGDLTEAIVITGMIRREIPVSKPFGDNERYDILIEDPYKNIIKAQIKTGWLDDGRVIFRANSQHTNSQGNVYKPYTDDVDIFLIYSHDLNEIYLIEETEFNSAINLRVEEPKQYHRDMNWARDYEFDRRWPPETDGSYTMTRAGDPISSVAIDALEEIGAQVFLPREVNRQECIAVNYEGESYTIRTERGRISDGRIHFEAKQKDMVDAFLVYTDDLDQLYAIDADGFDSTITLRLDPPTRHQPGIKYAEDFEFERNWPPTRLADPLVGTGDQTRATVELLESQGTDYHLEQTEGTIPTVIATINGETHRIRPERGWHTDGRLRCEPTEGSFDWYTIYDPENEELYLYDANKAGSQLELRLDEPKQWDPKINMAEEYRFTVNWPPNPE